MRPTESRVREALFSIWSARIRGARFLDLFAGSGAVGLEALGRGAGEVVLVESDRRVVRALETNATRLSEEGWRIVTASLPGGLARWGDERFDLVFADPPYGFEAYREVLVEVAGILEADGRVAVEHAGRRPMPGTAADLELLDERGYGDSALAIYGRS